MLEKHSIIDEILTGNIELSQPGGDGSFQKSFGLGVTLQDGSPRFVFLGGDDTVEELNVLQPFPCDGFPTDCEDVFFSGWTLGWPGDDTELAIDAAIEGFSPNDAFVKDAFWGQHNRGKPGWFGTRPNRRS